LRIGERGDSNERQGGGEDGSKQHGSISAVQQGSEAFIVGGPALRRLNRTAKRRVLVVGVGVG
jgi:hypothetical protein